MGIRQAVRLNPPAPPKSGRHDPHNVLLAEFTAEESKDIIHTLINMIGGAR